MSEKIRRHYVVKGRVQEWALDIKLIMPPRHTDLPDM